MNYELANKLKEAGFPQNDKHGNNLVCHSYDDDENCREDGHIAYAPALSELIEACGDKFAWLHHNIHKNAEYPWSAQTFLDEDGDSVGGAGKTAEDAVAKLWLTLNKHN